ARAGELPFATRPAGVLPVRVHVQPHFVAGPGDLLEVLPDAIRLRAQAGMRRGERLHAHEHAGVDVERDAVAVPPGALEQRGAGLEQALVDRAAAMEEELVILAQDQDRVPGDHGAPAPGPPRGAGRRVPVTAEKRRVASCRGRGIVRRSAGPSPRAAILAAPAPGAYRAAGGRDGVRRPECDGLHGPERRDEGRIDSPVDSRADVTGKLSTEYTVRKADPVADRHRILELWSRITSGAAPDADKLDRFYLDNPAGPGTIYLLWHEPSNAAVGVACVARRDVLVDGKLRKGAVCGDLYIDRAHRSLGPTLLLNRHILDELSRDYELYYAFPNARAAPTIAALRRPLEGKLLELVLPLRVEPYLERWLPGPLARILAIPGQLALDLWRKPRLAA